MKRITLSFLERCYQEGCFGYEEPTHVRLHPLHEKFVLEALVGQDTKATMQRRFNNAQFVYTPEVAGNFVEIVNINYLRNAAYNFSRKIEGEEVCVCCGRPS